MKDGKRVRGWAGQIGRENSQQTELSCSMLEHRHTECIIEWELTVFGEHPKLSRVDHPAGDLQLDPSCFEPLQPGQQSPTLRGNIIKPLLSQEIHALCIQAAFLCVAQIYFNTTSPSAVIYVLFLCCISQRSFVCCQQLRCLVFIISIHCGWLFPVFAISAQSKYPITLPAVGQHIRKNKQENKVWWVTVNRSFEVTAKDFKAFCFFTNLNTLRMQNM